jgi:undecaprenyl diphosphate synthase
MMNPLDRIDRTRIPAHVAVIMDGNGRWAKQKGEMRIFGHISGVESVRETLIAATELGVKYLTLYAFSAENWNRPEHEVEALMDLLVQTIANETDSLNENGVKLEAIGDLESLPQSCARALREAMERTASNNRITLILALSYSSRNEITAAARKLAKEVAEGKLSADAIGEELLSDYLYTRRFPDPELLIRTSGEHRISNFLLWQLAYTELYFTGVMWPDFDRNEFYRAILDYQGRERRFGMVSEQLNQ